MVRSAISRYEIGEAMAMKDKVKNLLQISKGKSKRAVGNAAGDQDLVAEGRMDEQSGNLKQAGEKVKDAFRKP
jgi:uncharacterized protein YjbJ (UPF0337 family)